MKFAIPFCGSLKLTEKILNTGKDKIDCVYFDLNFRYLGSGREQSGYFGILRSNKEKKKWLKDFDARIKELINELHRRNIKAYGLVNQLVFTYEQTKRFNEIKRYLNRIKDIGLDRLVVANPFALKIAKDCNYDVELSVNALVQEPIQLELLLQLFPNIKSMCVQREWNRNIDLIKQVKEQYKLEIKILVNEGCLPYCPYRIEHFSLMGLLPYQLKDERAAVSVLQKYGFCYWVHRKTPVYSLMSPFIRPEDIKLYEGIADVCKISGRTMGDPVLPMLCSAYFNSEFDGNLYFLLDGATDYVRNNFKVDNKHFPDDWGKTVSHCKYNCSECNYCLKVAEKIIKKNTRFVFEATSEDKEIDENIKLAALKRLSILVNDTMKIIWGTKVRFIDYLDNDDLEIQLLNFLFKRIQFINAFVRKLSAVFRIIRFFLKNRWIKWLTSIR
ncbi:MAG: U32 family peptidase [Elusimicrobiota bacterium]